MVMQPVRIVIVVINTKIIENLSSSQTRLNKVRKKKEKKNAAS